MTGEAGRPLLVGVSDPAGAKIEIYANLIDLGGDVAANVVLTADYEMRCPEGFPCRPTFTGASLSQYPHVVPAGTQLALLKCESAAMIVCGAATLVEGV